MMELARIYAPFREFLENSTIHGLVHIATAKSKVARALWVAIVVACFAFAIYMIHGSYREWQKSPVLTTITTHPITELDFPTVSVCPPRGSNTALNHLLEKVSGVNFTQKERQELSAINRKVFIEIPNEKLDKSIPEMLTSENVKSIINGKTSMPQIDGNEIVIKSQEPQGSFRTPGFDAKKQSEDFDRKQRSFHYVLDLQKESLREYLGDGSFVISVQSQRNWKVQLQKEKLELYQVMMTMQDAEDFCVSRGGHLPSVSSKEEEEELLREGRGTKIWLGATKMFENGSWNWLNNKSWAYENKRFYQSCTFKVT